MVSNLEEGYSRIIVLMLFSAIQPRIPNLVRILSFGQLLLPLADNMNCQYPISYALRGICPQSNTLHARRIAGRFLSILQYDFDKLGLDILYLEIPRESEAPGRKLKATKSAIVSATVAGLAVYNYCSVVETHCRRCYP